jgi:hypothetical protein
MPQTCSTDRCIAYTIRFLLSTKEYRKLVSRLGAKWLPLAPSPEIVEESSSSSGDHIHNVVRSQTRLYLSSYGTMAVLNAMVLKRRGYVIEASKIAASLTCVSGIYKIVYSLLSRLAEHQFKALEPLKLKPTSKFLVPLVSGVFAGSAYRLFPHQGKGYIALYVATRTAEFIYNYLDDMGLLEFKPRILGAWALFPFAFSQLFYTFIFYPDCCPASFRRIMLRLSQPYIAAKPMGYPTTDHWPNPNEIVSSIAVIARSRYPKFLSPILFPASFIIPSGLDAVEPVLAMAHPAITSLTGALTHPTEPSEFRTYAELILRDYSTVSKYVFGLYVVLGMVRRKSTIPNVLLSSVANAARTSTFIVMTVASAWSGIGLSQQILNNKFIPVMRFKLIGFLSGLWAFADQVNGHARYMYAVRLAFVSYWNTLVKERKGRPFIRHGDVMLFAVSFAVLMAIFDVSPGSIPGPSLRKSLNWVKTNRYEDPVTGEDKKDLDSK